MVRRSPEQSVDRFAWLHLLAIVGFAALAARLAFLQIVRAEYFTALAEAQRVRTSLLVPARGSLSFSEQGTERPAIAASTKLVPSAYAVPSDIKEYDRAAEVLADIVYRHELRAAVRRETLLVETGQRTPEEAEEQRRAAEERSPKEKLAAEEKRRQELKNDFVRRLGNPADPYEPLLSGGEQLDAEALAELQSMSLPGIVFREVPARVYPEGMRAAHLLGFVREVGSAARGEYGLEGGLDKVLRGEAGLTEAERDIAGRLISVGNSSLIPPEHGADVVLTVDRVLQDLAEKVAKAGRERFAAERAQVVVMDPNTGALLAMAAYPTFDPNNPGAIRDVGAYKNPLISDLFEPGSVLKPLVMAAALDEGLVDPGTTMVDRGPVKIGPYTINTYDGRHHGTVTMTEILEHSNNVGMVWVAQKVGAERLYQFLRRLGIGDRTGVPLEGEAAAALPLPDAWGDTRLATIGFGQGIVTTPLQMLAANAALVNGGRLLQPYLVREVRTQDGRVAVTQPKVVRQSLRPETSTKLRAMLASVVERGVAARAAVPGYYVGGKTGTAQVTDPATGRYHPENKIISFVGFAPVDNPAFIALIKLDNPAGLSFASGTAAPMFGTLAKQMLEYLRVPPSRPERADPLERK